MSRPAVSGITRVLWEAWSAPLRGAAKAAKHTVHTARPPPNITNPANAFKTFLNDATLGLFRSVRSSTNSPSSLTTSAARSYQNPTASFYGPASARFSTRAPFTARASPLRFPTHPSHVGLGVARNFSSARPIFENIIQNVPLGLRALGDHAGIDERKWKKVRNGIRREHKQAMKKVNKAKMVAVITSTQQQEFDEYFPLSSSAAPASEADAAETASVVLILALQSPAVEALLANPHSISSSSSPKRLITPQALKAIEDISNLYDTRKHQIRAIHNRLSASGAFDFIEGHGLGGVVKTEVKLYSDRTGEEWIFFGRGWTVGDVRSALGIWEEDAELLAGCRVVDLASGKSASMDVISEGSGGSSRASVSPVLSSWGLEEDEAGYISPISLSDEEEAAIHDQVASTFILPDLTYSISIDDTASDSSTDDEYTIMWDDEDFRMSSSRAGFDDGIGEEPWRFAASDSLIEYQAGARELLDEIERSTREREFAY